MWVERSLKEENEWLKTGRQSLPLNSCRSPKCLIVEGSVTIASEVPGSSHTLMKLHAALNGSRNNVMISLCNRIEWSISSTYKYLVKQIFVSTPSWRHIWAQQRARHWNFETYTTTAEIQNSWAYLIMSWLPTARVRTHPVCPPKVTPETGTQSRRLQSPNSLSAWPKKRHTLLKHVSIAVP